MKNRRKILIAVLISLIVIIGVVITIYLLVGRENSEKEVESSLKGSWKAFQIVFVYEGEEYSTNINDSIVIENDNFLNGCFIQSEIDEEVPSCYSVGYHYDKKGGEYIYFTENSTYLTGKMKMSWKDNNILIFESATYDGTRYLVYMEKDNGLEEEN